MVYWLLCRLIKVWIVTKTLLKTRLLTFWMKVHLTVKCDRLHFSFSKRVELKSQHIQGNISYPLFLEGREFWDLCPKAKETKAKWKMGPNLTLKLLHIRGNHQKHIKTNYWVEGNICKYYYQQGVIIQNI